MSDKSEKGGAVCTTPRCTTLIKKAKSQSAEVIPVICVKVSKGAGTSKNMARIIAEYWSLDGELLAVHDPVDEDYDCGGLDGDWDSS